VACWSVSEIPVSKWGWFIKESSLSQLNLF
jgi:hypothetical protein